MDIVRKIDQHLMEKEQEEWKVSLSAIGRCARSLWYQHREEYKRAQLPARSLKVFMFGDMIEDQVVELAKQTGARVLYTGEDQLTVKLSTPLGELGGHPDGVIYGDSGTPFLLEVKSCSDVGWKWSPGWSKLDHVPEDNDYYLQIQAYLWSEEIQEMGIDTCCLIVVAKNTSHMKQIMVPRDEDALETIMDQATWVAQDSPPVRPYDPHYEKKKKRMILKYPCSYCGYVRHCHPEHVVYIEGGKPVHVTEENV